ncbi:MAG TPA: hypothetical protein VFU99_09185 [Gaiellaceae bacterium]|nr:hypothetical protein [Gaiellaceae bacterium]
MRSTLVKTSVTTAVVAAALSASACAGSDDSTDSASAAVTAQVQKICDERAASFANRGEFPVDDFDPENPDPADLPAVGDYFAAGLNDPGRAIAALTSLDASGEEGALVSRAIEAFEAEYAGARAQVDAALSADVEGFVATLDDATATKDALGEATSALGVPDCAQG